MRTRIVVSASVMFAALAVSVWLCRNNPSEPKKDPYAVARLHADVDEVYPLCIRSLTAVRAGGSLRLWFCSSMGSKSPGHIQVIDVNSGQEVLRRVASSHAALLEAVVNVGDLDGDAFDDVLVVEMNAEIQVSICSGHDGHALHHWTTKNLLYGAVALPCTRRDAGIRLAFIASSQIEIRSMDDGTILFDSASQWDAGRHAVMSATSHVLCPCGDVDADGRIDFCVSVRHPEQDAPSEVWVVSGESGRILRVIPEPEQTVNFGCSLAEVGDIDGDGQADIAIGSDGAAFLVSPTDGRVIEVIREPARGDFGCLVHAAGDFDGDGRPDLFVGATTEEPGHPFGVGPYFEIRSGRTGLSLLRRHIAYDSLDGTLAVAELGSVSSDHDHQVAVYQPLFNDDPMFSWIHSSRSAIDIISGTRSRGTSH